MKEIILIAVIVGAVAYIIHLESKLSNMKRTAVENLQLGLDIQRARDGLDNKQRVANRYGALIEEADFEAWATSELKRRGLFTGYDLGIPND